MYDIPEGDSGNTVNNHKDSSDKEIEEDDETTEDLDPKQEGIILSELEIGVLCHGGPHVVHEMGEGVGEVTVHFQIFRGFTNKRNVF